AVLEMHRAVGAARREACIVVERLVVRLEIGTARVTLVDDLAVFLRRLPAVRQREIPGAGIPGPADAFGGERVADGPRRLRRHRLTPALRASDVRKIGISFDGRRN